MAKSPIPRAAAVAVWATLGCAAAHAAGSDDAYAAAPSPLQSAVDAIRAQRYDYAIQLLEPYTQRHARDADGFNWLGYAYRKTGQLPLAFSRYERALALDPKHRGAHEYIGEAYLQDGRPAQAEQHLQRLQALCGDCEEYLELQRAIAAYRAGAK